jgi:hypothetical protein
MHYVKTETMFYINGSKVTGAKGNNMVLRT